MSKLWAPHGSCSLLKITRKSCRHLPNSDKTKNFEARSWEQSVLWQTLCQVIGNIRNSTIETWMQRNWPNLPFPPSRQLQLAHYDIVPSSPSLSLYPDESGIVVPAIRVQAEHFFFPRSGRYSPVRVDVQNRTERHPFRVASSPWAHEKALCVSSGVEKWQRDGRSWILAHTDDSTSHDWMDHDSVVIRPSLWAL